jgi:sec-independent protein translocase protein TatB
MFDIGWSEIAVIAVVALIVIGPKDLPGVLRTVGIWVRKARMMAREFQGHVDDMIREAELEDVRRQANELRNLNIGREVEKAIDPTGSLRDAFNPNVTSTSQTTSKTESSSGTEATAVAPDTTSPTTAADPAPPAGQPAPAPVAALPAVMDEPKMPVPVDDNNDKPQR